MNMRGCPESESLLKFEIPLRQDYPYSVGAFYATWAGFTPNNTRLALARTGADEFVVMS